VNISKNLILWLLHKCGLLELELCLAATGEKRMSAYADLRM